MQGTKKQVRDRLRLLHILGSVVLGAFIYSPWGSDPLFLMLTGFVVFPVLALTGIWMWKGDAIQSWLQQLLSSWS
jgi:hypothetical protein